MSTSQSSPSAPAVGVLAQPTTSPGNLDHADGRARSTKLSGRKREGMEQSNNENPIAWRRERNEENKRRKLERDDYKSPIYAAEFTKDEIAAEERRPKRKVAVMIGYSGTGYHGMQLSHDMRTIEGDLFQAFVKAGAVSKANADDPKKTGFARCARTDKGVHAAGNVVSLKLIIDDDALVQRINDNLSPQIRVWGIERTSNSFSAYTLCDSRMYEYLIPTHCFLPPHPSSYMGHKLRKIAEEASDTKGYNERQADVVSFWDQAYIDHIQPALDTIDDEIRDLAFRRIFDGEVNASALEESRSNEEFSNTDIGRVSDKTPARDDLMTTSSADAEIAAGAIPEDEVGASQLKDSKPKPGTPLDIAMRQIKSAILAAKKAWRITPKRLRYVENALSRYVGVHNYHNYTVQKLYKDPAAKRVIKSFVVDGKPMIIGNTEWLSLKVHGQSFMMHQVRKMVGMAALSVRSGTDLNLIQKSLGTQRLSIPRAPGLGLLLERPIFEAYNQKLQTQQGAPDRNPLRFDKHAKEMDEFKQREIYGRIYREEEQSNVFHQLFWAIDQLRDSQFLYLSSKGADAVEHGKERGLHQIPLIPEDASDVASEDRGNSDQH